MQEKTGRSRSDSGGGEKKKETLVSGVESIPLHCTRAVGTYNSSTAAGTPQHTNVAEAAIHFLGIGLGGRRFWRN